MLLSASLCQVEVMSNFLYVLKCRPLSSLVKVSHEVPFIIKFLFSESSLSFESDRLLFFWLLSVNCY